jgi:hypothetical protein
VYSTYLGGAADDQGRGIAVDPSEHAYVTGTTKSTNFPLAHPLQPTFGGGFADAFVAKLNRTGSALAYSTYLGGTGGDTGNGIAVDPSGNAFMTGGTGSPDFPTKNALQPVLAGGDAFVTKLDPTGSHLVFSTYLGGSDGDEGLGIAVDLFRRVTIVGDTFSTDFPTRHPVQPTFGGSEIDAFVATLNDSGSQLVFSTYLVATPTIWQRELPLITLAIFTSPEILKEAISR